MFTQNSAGEFGGAIYAHAESTVIWTRETTFIASYAGIDGAALYAKFNSAISWNSDTKSAPDASVKGGVGHVRGAAESSSVCSGVKTSFSGMPFEAPDSTVMSDGLTTFERNIACYRGGAVFAPTSRMS